MAPKMIVELEPEYTEKKTKSSGRLLQVAPIHHDVREVEKWIDLGNGIAIFSYSQATLKAISSAILADLRQA